MSNLVVYQNKDGLELHIDNTTGEVFASISATARMVDRNESTLRDFIGSRKWQLKTAEVYTPGGLQGARLLDESQILECFIKYKHEVPDKQYGKVNAYPIELVDEYYRGLGLVS